MEQLPENNAEQSNRSAPITQKSLGGMLREAREHLGLSVADVAAQIKFAPRQIEALEAGDYGNLPEAAFLRGFVRSYAKILQLDAQTLLAAMPQAKPVAAELTPASVEVPFPAAYSPQRQTLVLLGAAFLLALVVIGFTLWTPHKKTMSAKIENPVTLPSEMQILPESSAKNNGKGDASNPPETKQSTAEIEKKSRSSETGQKSKTSDTEKKSRTADADQISINSETGHKPAVRVVKTKEAVSGVPSTQTAESMVRDDTPARIITIRLVFDEESWTEIKDGNGNMISSQINPRGSELKLDGRLPLSLVIGHAASAHLYQDGEPVDLTPFINSSSEVARITLE